MATAPELRTISQPILTKQTEEYDPHPQYKFSYDVQDALTGDSKSQTESRDGDVVQGEYSLTDADGFRRTVQYTADAVNGFNAVVHREPLVAAPVVKTVAPVAYTAAHPVAYSAPIVKTVAAAPVAYTAGHPVAYSAPIVKTVSAVHPVTYSSAHPVAYPAPVVKTFASAPVAYTAAHPVAYSAPVVRTVAAAPVAYTAAHPVVNTVEYHH